MTNAIIQGDRPDLKDGMNEPLIKQHHVRVNATHHVTLRDSSLGGGMHMKCHMRKAR